MRRRGEEDVSEVDLTIPTMAVEEEKGVDKGGGG